MAYLERIINTISKAFFQISKAGVAALMILIVVNIILRKVWHSIYGTYDYVGFITALMVAFTIGYLALQKGHIAVDLLMDRFPKRFQAIVALITNLLCLAMFSLVAWSCVVLGNSVYQSGERSFNSLTPYYPFLYGISLGVALLCLAILFEIIENLMTLVRR